MFSSFGLLLGLLGLPTTRKKSQLHLSCLNAFDCQVVCTMFSLNCVGGELSGQFVQFLLALECRFVILTTFMTFDHKLLDGRYYSVISLSYLATIDLSRRV